MFLEHRVTMNFERGHVQESLVCEMARRCPGLLFNIDVLSVGMAEAMMTISLIGEPPEIRSAEEYFQSVGVAVRVLSSDKYKGSIPSIPARSSRPQSGDAPVERKFWLTIIGTKRKQPYLWVLARRYDVTFTIAQSTTGDPVSIVSLIMKGPRAEVDGAIAYLREQGIGVENGELPPPATFVPRFDH